ncbi:MAG: hypothetical protein Ct9H300mP6_17990 [Gammaproteobacteria bacterium]|nr:MAG: hypothetical protein Ct9H300mP6_17990 [Gammaproteobacteria bacterium]
MLSSPDHRGATGPMLFSITSKIEFVGEESVKLKQEPLMPFITDSLEPLVSSRTSSL